MKPFFSIIIPVYNTQEYIARCLDSCVNQTFKDFEVIIVDDCGTDNSMQIAQEYVKKDDRFYILHNSYNLGGFYARLAGDTKALGKYTIYVDSDDFIEYSMLERIYDKIMQYYNQTNEYIDIIHFDFDFFPKNTRINTYFLTLKECNILTPENKKRDIIENYFLKHKNLHWSLCDKAHKTSIIRQTNKFILLFLNKKKFTSCDDALKSFLILLHSKTNIKIDQKLYYYAFIQKDEKNILSRINEAKYVIDLLDKLDNTPVSKKNKYFLKAKQKIQKQIKKNIEMSLYYNQCTKLNGGGEYGNI